jgi:hypothetical protein
MKEEGLCLYRVIRDDAVLFVYIMYNRADGKYHFVNFTHNHICPCAFDTIEDAVKDLEEYKQVQKIRDYQKI